MTDHPRYHTCLGCGARALPEQLNDDLCDSCLDRYRRTGRDWWRHA